MEKILSPALLWQDFDATAEQLETDILKRQEKDGFVMEQLYFTGRTFDESRRSRIYAKICYKNTSSKKPAMLIVDDVVKSVDFDELLFWAEQGFVAMAIDFAGQREKGLFTLYPEEVKYANAQGENAVDDFLITQTAKETKWYEYALCGMRAVTYLKSLNFVKSVSLVTIGNGAKVGLIILAMDKRINNGVAVFGNLYCQYPDLGKIDDDVEVADDSDEINMRLEQKEKEQIWTAGLAPQSYVPLVTVPLYVICAGNSGIVDVVEQSKAYFRVNDDSRMLILPTVIDYLPNDYAKSIVKWCKGYAAPDDMELSRIEDIDGKPALKLTTTTPISQLQLWYCRDASQKGKNWVQTQLIPKDDGYVATLDVYEENSHMLAFALDNGDIALSTALFDVKVTNPIQLCKPTTLLYSGESDMVFISIHTAGNWHGQELPVGKCKGYLDIVGTRGKAMATFAVNDKSLKYATSNAISFDICSQHKCPLTVYAVCDFGKNNSVYSAVAPLVGDGKWQRLTFETSHFHRVEDGRVLAIDDDVDMFGFVSEESFIINNIFLV